MDSLITGEQFNALFSAAVERGDEDMKKVANVTGLFIQRRLRENSFFRKIIPIQTVTPRDCVPTVGTEGLKFIDNIEPDSVAMSVNFRGEPEKNYMVGAKYEFDFFVIASRRMSKTEMELWSYKMPFTRIIEQNTVKDIQQVEDLKAMEHVHRGLYFATRRRYNDLVATGEVSGTADLPTSAAFAAYLFTKDKTTAFPIAIADLDRADGYYSNIILSDATEFSRTVLRDLVNVCANRAQDARVLLVHQATWNDILAWAESEAGLEVTSEIVRGGYKAASILGLTFVTTLRQDRNIVRPGVIYAFPSPQFLGRFLLLEGTKFWIHKHSYFIEMQAWETVGMGFGNVYGLSALLLLGASIPLSVNMTTDGEGTFELINDFEQTSIPTPS